MPENLAGKVAVITGGASGIGLASVEALVVEGARVVLGDSRDVAGTAVAARFGDDVRFRHCDVTKESQIAALVAAAVEEFGGLDIMFNNASGLGDPSPLVDLTNEGLDRAIRVTTGSVVAGHRHAAKVFQQHGIRGSIISTGSGAGLLGGMAPAGYAIGKAAVLGVVRQAAAELGPSGIRTNAICPGITLTPTFAQGIPKALKGEFLDALADALKDEQPLGRVGLAEDVANCAVFLASDLSAFVTGAVLPVDGGATAVSLSRLSEITARVRRDLISD